MDQKAIEKSIKMLISEVTEDPTPKTYKEALPRLRELEPNRRVLSQRIVGELSSGNLDPLVVSKALIDKSVEKFGNEGTRHGAFLSLLLATQRDRLAGFTAPILKRIVKPAPNRIPASGAQKSSSKGTIEIDKSVRLGKGNCTIVYPGIWYGRKVAVKQMFYDPSDDKMLLSEIGSLLKVDCHENVVQYFGSETHDQDPFTLVNIVLERCDFSLSDCIEKKACIQAPIDYIDLLHQTTKGLVFLHDMEIIHRDVKPQNILVKLLSESETRVKIADFGICRLIPRDRTSVTLNTNSGTSGWMAPEVLEVVTQGKEKIKSRLSKETDIWALGCVYHYVLFDGTHLFGNNENFVNAKVSSDQPEINLKLENANIAGYLTLILKMTSKNAKHRPPASAILRHHIFWSKKTALHFIAAVSNAIDQPMECSLANECLEILKCNPIMNFYCLPQESYGWIRFLCPVLQSYAKRSGCKRYPYHGDRIQELLRIIRNMSVHYGHLPENTQLAVGTLTEDFWDYWSARFPLLVDQVWIIFENLKKDPVAGLGEYYCEAYEFKMGKIFTTALSDVFNVFVEKLFAKEQIDFLQKI